MRAHSEGDPRLDFWQIRRQILAAFLPDLFSAILAPLLIYRLASPHMPAISALLLAGIPPVIRLGTKLLRQRRLNPLSVLSLLTIAVKIVSALAFKTSWWLLVSGSLIAGVHGGLCLASLFTSRPLLLWMVEGMMAQTPAASRFQWLRRWLETTPRFSFAVVTAVWGVALLLDAVLNVLLASTLSIEQFMLISPLVHYGLLGGVLLGTLLIAWRRRSRKEKEREELLQQREHERYAPPLSH